MQEINTAYSSFELIRKNNFLYVDKTRYIYNMIANKPRMIFLSRPRRFGKSLTLSTLDAAFRGKRELFTGLYIDSTDYDWKEYPVIHVDFGLCGATGADDCALWINDKLDDIAGEYGVTLAPALYYTKFDRLITVLSQRAPVVILIDEYDKMLSNNMYNPEVEAIRDVTRAFFEVIKAKNDLLRFVFITGVTKYSKVSIFSSMNNVRDYSMSDEYASAFGYTEKELETYFGSYIERGIENSGKDRETYLSELKSMYDGYRFAPGVETLYNPVSIGMFFASGGKTFNGYWVDTGGTKLLMEAAKKVNYNIDSSLDEPLSLENIAFFDIVDIASSSVSLMEYKALLLQTGYLTIKKSEDDGNTLFLGYPNVEVKSAFASIMLTVYAGGKKGTNLNSVRLGNAFENRDTVKAMTIIKSYFASLNYLLSSRSVEADYHLMFHCMLMAVDADVNVEVATNKGRIDGVLRAKNTIYVIELKRDESADAALNQIKDNSYMERYYAWCTDCPDYEIHLLGINFSSEERNISGWKEEVLSCR